MVVISGQGTQSSSYLKLTFQTLCDEYKEILEHSQQYSDGTAGVAFHLNYTASSVVNIILLTDE